MLDQNLIHQIIEHADAYSKQEVCGYVLNNKVYRAVNVAADPSIDFLLDGESTLAVITARENGGHPIIYHSHINTNDDWSLADIQSSRKLLLPYFLYHQPSGTKRFYDPLAISPYEGRQFHWLTDNCYSLIQDAFRREFQITLPDFYLNHPTEYSEPHFNRYLESIEAAGFIKLPADADLRKGDLIVTLMGTPNPAHGVMVWSPEENTILEHFAGQLSRMRSYSSVHRKYTRSVWRHKQLT
ncbi:MAG TPA: Mov34/MPN/PAD-1 family protein [Trichocoleus sp.]|jgi:proteasome lid subunit RPN8/RPN11